MSYPKGGRVHGGLQRQRVTSEVEMRDRVSAHPFRGWARPWPEPEPEPARPCALY